MWQRCSPANIYVTAMPVITGVPEHRCGSGVPGPGDLAGIWAAAQAGESGGTQIRSMMAAVAMAPPAGTSTSYMGADRDSPAARI